MAQILLIKAIYPPGWMGSSSLQAVGAGVVPPRPKRFVTERRKTANIARNGCSSHVAQLPECLIPLQGQGAALSDPNTGRKVSACPGIHSTERLLGHLSLCALHAPANTAMLSSVSIQPTSRQRTQESHNVEDGGETGRGEH